MKQRQKDKQEKKLKGLGSSKKKETKEGTKICMPSTQNEILRRDAYDSYNDALWSMMEAEDYCERIADINMEFVQSIQEMLDETDSYVSVFEEKFNAYKEYRMKLLTPGKKKDVDFIDCQKFKNFFLFGRFLSQMLLEHIGDDRTLNNGIIQLHKSIDSCLQKISILREHYYEFINDVFHPSKERKQEKVRSHYDLVYNAIPDDLSTVFVPSDSDSKIKSIIDRAISEAIVQERLVDGKLTFTCGFSGTGKSSIFTALQKTLLSGTEKTTLQILKDGHKDAEKIALEVEERSMSSQSIDDMFFRMALYDKLERKKTPLQFEIQAASGRPPANMFDKFTNHDQFEKDVCETLDRADIDIFSYFKRKLKVSRSMLALIILEKFCNGLDNCYGMMNNFFESVVTKTKSLACKMKRSRNITKEYEHRQNNYNNISDGGKKEKKLKMYDIVRTAVAACIAPLCTYFSM